MVGVMSREGAEGSVAVRAELLVEPFVEGRPGPHVEAVMVSLAADGLEVDMGPFASAIEGPLGSLLDAVNRAVRAGFDAGATAIQFRVERR